MRKTLVIIIALLNFSFTPPVGTDYRKVFGSDYAWAVNWLKQNDQLIVIYAARYKMPAKELKAIIFPELVRYNSVFDALQIESLKFLYVSEGKDYANFSVGFFQMKPSFAEAVEADADAGFGYVRSFDDEDSRRLRVRRLTTTVQQLNYLCAFYDICLKRFSAQQFATAGDRVKFFATAYNAGYHLSVGKLAEMQGRKFFNGHNYSDIALFYYLNE